MASEAKRGCGYRQVGGMYLVGPAFNAPCDRLPMPLPACMCCGHQVSLSRTFTEFNPYKVLGMHDDEAVKTELKAKTLPEAFRLLMLARGKTYRDVAKETGIGKTTCWHFSHDPRSLKAASFLAIVRWMRLTATELFALWDEDGTEVALKASVGGPVCKDEYRPCLVCDPKDGVAFAMRVGNRFYTPASFLEEANTMGISKRIPFIPHKLVMGKTVIYLAHKEAIAVEVPGEDGKEPKTEYTPGFFGAFIPTAVEKLMWQSEAEALTDEDKERMVKQGIQVVPIPDGDPDHA